MDTLTIYRGVSEILTLDIDEKTVLTKKLMGEHNVKLVYDAGAPLNIQIGDYIILGSEVYTINRAPEIKKRSNIDYGYTITFDGFVSNLNKKMYISSDGLAEFSLNGMASDFLALLCTNMNTLDPKWSQGTVDSTDYKTITFQNETCREALNHIASEFDLEWDVNIRVIDMEAEVGETSGHTFSYGKNNGLYSLEQKQINDKNIITKVYGFGGTENIPDTYRSGAKKLVFEERFLTKNTDRYGIIEGQYTDEDIYPKLTDAKGLVTNVAMSFPDGVYDPYNSYIEASNIDFDLNNYLIEGVTARIVFKTGDLAGREHEIWKWDNTNKRIYFNQYLDADGYATPVSGTIPAVSDTFALLGIELPQTYIDTAEDALEAATQAYLDKMSVPQVTYGLEIDQKYAELNDIDFNAGDKVTIIDSSFGLDSDIRVSEVSRPLTNLYAISCTISDSVTYNQQGYLVKGLANIKKTDAISTLVTYEEIRKASLRMSQLRDLTYDPDGFFRTERITPLSIDTLYISVGAKSTDFRLATSVIKPNYGGDSERLVITAGSLVHNQVNNSGNYIWTMSSFDTGASYLTPATPYYLYAKCSTSAQTGEFVLDTQQRAWDYATGYYYFWVGVLYATSDSVRDYSFVNGMSYINGRTITTGRIQSVDTYNYIDLENNTFRLGNATGALDWNVTTADTLTVTGALVVNSIQVATEAGYDPETAYQNNVTIQGGDIYEATHDSDSYAYVYINAIGYQGGTTKYRSLAICNGKGGYLMDIKGDTGNIGFLVPTAYYPVGFLLNYDASAALYAPLYAQESGATSKRTLTLPPATTIDTQFGAGKSARNPYLFIVNDSATYGLDVTTGDASSTFYYSGTYGKTMTIPTNTAFGLIYYDQNWYAISGGAGGSGDVTATSYTQYDLAVWDSTSRQLIDTSGKLAFNGSYLTITGHSTSWGTAMTSGHRVTMGTSTSATWLIGGYSSTSFRGGVQLIDSGGTMRLYYSSTGYLSVGSSLSLDGVIVPTLANNKNNYVVTATGSGLNGEANLTFDGSTLGITGSATVSSRLGFANGSAASPSLYLTGSTTTGFYRYADGDIGVSSAGDLEFLFDGGAGNFHAEGDIIAYSSTTSDKRLKDNINKISGSLLLMARLNPVTFEWKYRKELTEFGTKKQHSGFIAQDLMDIFPDMVNSTKLPFHIDPSMRKEDFYVIRYQEIIPYLVGAVNELKSEKDIEIENLNKRVISLEKEVVRLGGVL